MEKTRGQLEAAISEAIIRFEKEFMGRGPLEAKTYIVDDMILVRLGGVLTPAEIKLAEEGVDGRGKQLIKQVRQELLERGRPLLETAIKSIAGLNVRSLHTDISTRTGERIIVFSMDGLVPFRRISAPGSNQVQENA